MDVLNSLFETKSVNVYGEVVSIDGARYTLRDQLGRTSYAYAKETYKAGQWVLATDAAIIQSVNRPSVLKVYEV